MIANFYLLNKIKNIYKNSVSDWTQKSNKINCSVKLRNNEIIFSLKQRNVKRNLMSTDEILRDEAQ